MAVKPGTDLETGLRENAATAERRDAFRAARHHSLRVKVLKIVLPLSALALIAGFVFHSWISTPADVSFDIASTSWADGKLVMANPKLEGFDSSNRPYVMTALQAVQDAGNSGLFELETIDAKLPIDADRWATLQAPRGIFNRDSNTIEFSGDILITTSDGMSAKFSRAFFDIGKGDLQTSEPVDIDAGSTRIKADAMKVLENGKVLIFENHIQMQIVPEQPGTGQDKTGDIDEGQGKPKNGIAVFGKADAPQHP